MAEENLHANHRARMQERVDRDGLDSLAEHEALEYLLDDTGKTRIFQNQPEAEAFLLCHGFTSEDLEHFYFVEVPENEE